jgi:ubiquinone/menaquinone biosynthesis C-methylase UbiE
MTETRSTQMVAAVWDGVADSWERNHAFVAGAKAPVTRAMFDGLALHPGDRVLELGSGTGELAAQVADLVGPTGAVVATDVAEAMVAVAARTLAGRPSVTVQVADAAQLDGVGADFDAVLCRMGLMFLEDPAIGFREIHRVLRPGGRMAVAVWAGPEHNPWMTVVGMSAMAAGLPVEPPFGPGGPFSLGDPVHLEALAVDAGFEAVAVDAVELVFPFADAAEHVAINGSLAPNLASVLRDATADQLDVVRAMVADATAGHATDGGLRVPGRALVVHGRR